VVAVSFSVKPFGYHRELEPVLFEFLLPLGDNGYDLTVKIMEFVENVQGTLLGTVGFVFLLYSVISMIQKVEAAFNVVWHVERPRSLARRLSEYTVVMLVGPIVAVVAMGLLASIEASAVMSRLSGMTGHVVDGTGHHVAPLCGHRVVRVYLLMHAQHTGRAARRSSSCSGVLGPLRAVPRVVVLGAHAGDLCGFRSRPILFVDLRDWSLLRRAADVLRPASGHLRSGHSDIPMAAHCAASASIMHGRDAGQPAALERQRPGRAAQRPGIVINEVAEALEDRGRHSPLGTKSSRRRISGLRSPRY
jgi:hypothetical protein